MTYVWRFKQIIERRRGNREESRKSKQQFQPEYGGDRRGPGLPNPYCETKFLGANGDREIFIFPVQLTTSGIGNLTRGRFFLTLAISLCDHHT